MNHLFNNANQVRYIEHHQEIRKLEEIAAKLELASTEFKHQNSVIYGAKFYTLCDSEQNNFNPTELQIAAQLLLVMSHFFFKRKEKVPEILKAISGQLPKLKEKPKTENALCFEEKVRTKLCAHLEATVDFFRVLSKEKFDLSEIIKCQNFHKGNRVQEKYFYVVMNLIAVANFRTGNLATANKLFCRLLSTCLSNLAPSPEGYEFDGLSRLNNPFFQTNFKYNTFLSFYALKEYVSAAHIGESLMVAMSANHHFWYVLGLCHFHIWLRKLKEQGRYEFTKGMEQCQQISRNLERRQIRLILAPIQKLEFSSPDMDSKQMAISCLEASLNILQNLTNKDHLKTVFSQTDKRLKDFYNEARNVIVSQNQQHLLSVLEHLSYLYLACKKPMQALKTITLGINTPQLKPSEQIKFHIYHTKAIALLKRQTLVKKLLQESQNTQNCEFCVQLNESISLPLSFITKFNKVSILSVDADSLIDEFLRLSPQQKSVTERPVQNLLFHHFSKVEFSRDALRNLINGQYQKFSKNGKN